MGRNNVRKGGWKRDSCSFLLFAVFYRWIGQSIGQSNFIKGWAVRRGDLEGNPVEPIKPELVKKIKNLSVKGANEADVAVLSDEEMKRFESEAKTVLPDGIIKYPAGDYCLLLLYTGMRVGEMIALRWIDWEGDFLTIEKSVSMAKNREKNNDSDNNFVSVEGTTKNQKARIIELNKDAKATLERIKEQRGSCNKEDFIAVTRTGKLNTASNLEHRMKVIMKNAGLEDVKGGLHIFRKTFATRMYESGARVEEIAAYIGDLESTTRKYYIAIRKKVMSGKEIRQVVKLPGKAI